MAVHRLHPMCGSDGGAEAMTGVIFPPQVALVGLGTPQVRP
ncbi:hypothetical protein ACVDG3_20250 [Meridianimarinicoccus sp. RP-17]